MTDIIILLYSNINKGVQSQTHRNKNSEVELEVAESSVLKVSVKRLTQCIVSITTCLQYLFRIAQQKMARNMTMLMRK